MEFFDILFKAAMVLVPISIGYLLFMIGQFFKEVTARTKQTEVTINELNKTLGSANEIMDDVKSKLAKIELVFDTLEQAAGVLSMARSFMSTKFTRKEK